MTKTIQKCFECRRPAAHKHYVVPRSQGGTRFAWLCESCHAKTHGEEKLATISTLTRDALDAKRERLERIGSIPYGFAVREGKLVERPDEFPALEIMRSMRERGASYREIGDELRAKGFKPRGRYWHPSSVRSILETRRRYRRPTG